MRSFVQLTMKEYEDLKEDAKGKRIKIESGVGVKGPDGKLLEANIKIDMRELKLQICRQQDIDPDVTTVNFY